MGNDNTKIKSDLSFMTQITRIDVEEIFRRYRNAPPQSVIDGRSCPSFQATSNYLKTILTGVVDGVVTGSVSVNAVFDSFKNNKMELNEQEEMSFPPSPPPPSPPSAPPSSSPEFLPSLTTETINILPFLSVLLMACSSESGFSSKFDLLFDVFYFSPSSQGTMSADGVALMILTVLRGVGILLKDLSPENQMASFSVDKLEGKIVRELFPDPSVAVTKERFVEWSMGVLSTLAESDYDNLPVIYATLQS